MGFPSRFEIQRQKSEVCSPPPSSSALVVVVVVVVVVYSGFCGSAIASVPQAPCPKSDLPEAKQLRLKVGWGSMTKVKVNAFHSDPKASQVGSLKAVHLGGITAATHLQRRRAGKRNTVSDGSYFSDGPVISRVQSFYVSVVFDVLSLYYCAAPPFRFVSKERPAAVKKEAAPAPPTATAERRGARSERNVNPCACPSVRMGGDQARW